MIKITILKSKSDIVVRESCDNNGLNTKRIICTNTISQIFAVNMLANVLLYYQQKFLLASEWK